ncbi:MAG: DUF192 domain-containing protein [Candidatus Bathyarchaeia archaeon]|jgi:uncharacterized membrane protein (UPF0127 family)
MNKVVVGSLLVFLTLAAAVGYSVSQHKTSHIIISGTLLTVELAETPPAQEKGLSGRPSLPDDHGMLFVFDHQDYWGFWMIDMKFHLDIIWFDSNRQVVFIESNLSPCTTQNCPVFTPNAKALYVLEVNAGFVAAHQLTYGTSFIPLDL